MCTKIVLLSKYLLKFITISFLELRCKSIDGIILVINKLIVITMKLVTF
jgi:hypothetical protein